MTVGFEYAVTDDFFFIALIGIEPKTVANLRLSGPRQNMQWIAPDEMRNHIVIGDDMDIVPGAAAGQHSCKPPPGSIRIAIPAVQEDES